MTAAPLPDDVADMLARPNPAVITTVRPDGQPVSVATWYLLDPGTSRILVNMDEGRKRLAYLRNDPRVSLTALDGTPRPVLTGGTVGGSRQDGRVGSRRLTALPPEGRPSRPQMSVCPRRMPVAAV